MPRPDWSRELPQPLKIPDLMTLRTLADVRSLMGYLPAEHRERHTWQTVAKRLEEAAQNGNVGEAAIALRIVLMLEKVPCLPQ
ncbi:MAG: hypothetical protein WA776_14055 [Xanthobacteraceae bacterium]